MGCVRGALVVAHVPGGLLLQWSQAEGACGFFCWCWVVVLAYLAPKGWDLALAFSALADLLGGMAKKQCISHRITET